MSKISLFVDKGVIIDLAENVGKQENGNPINLDTGMRYGFPVEIIEVDTDKVPKDYEYAKYLYDVKKGIIPNPNYSKPNATAEEALYDLIPSLTSRIDDLEGGILELVDYVAELEDNAAELEDNAAELEDDISNSEGTSEE